MQKNQVQTNFVKDDNVLSQAAMLQIMIRTYFIQKFACPHCSSKYRSKVNLNWHIRGTHKIGEPTNCKSCGREDFISYSQYYVHTRKCKLLGAPIVSVRRIT